MNVENALKEYILSLSSKDGRSQNTIESYQRDLRKYQNFLNEKGISRIEEIRDAQFLQIIIHL